ncbi:Ig-like domain-containing protein [Vibrio hepatarius]|uniref:Ig-like domain-containing protein n=1 Tax=Vibrio hepatarius TaxID=171383 RepID=UPI001C08AAE1|nr:Ig-like domain-containing protein [Vibrio hepatarius]MBU2895686.1 Ig-like domain repeat protein [Vibrio hepatarius]
MKRVFFEEIHNGSLPIVDIKNAGFDLIVSTSDGQVLRVENGLTDLVTNRAKVTFANGSVVDYKSLIEKFIVDKESIKTLDINFIGDSENSLAADKEGTGVKEGAINEVTFALKEILDAAESFNFEGNSPQLSEEEIQAALKKAIEDAKATKEVAELEDVKPASEESTEEAEGEEEKSKNTSSSEAKEQAEQNSDQLEGMKNDLKGEKVDPNDNTSKLTGEYETPPPVENNNSSSSSGKYDTEGEPKEEETYEFKVSLKADSDSGSKGDFITNVGEPVFAGTGIPTSVVTININGVDNSTTVDGEGNWVLPPIPKLDEGEYSYSAKDTAGNKVSGTLVIDQTNTLTHDLQNDTGVSDSDNITQDSRLVFVGKTDAGAEVILKINGKEYKATANANGDYTVKVTDSLPDNTFDYEIISTDVADNEISEAGKVTVDTKIDASVALSEENDSGASNSDGITNHNEDITFVGKIEQGATAFFDFNGIKYPVQIQEDGSWSVTIPTLLDDKSYDYKLEVTDLAGNHEVISGQIVVDTTTSVSGGLDKASDTGKFNTDGITMDTKPYFSGEGEPKATVVVTINNRDYQTVVGSDGKWKLQVTNELPDAELPYTIVITDLAGNKHEIGDKIVVDTGVTVTAHLQTDTGISDSDNITKNKNNVIVGKAEEGASATITITGLNGGKPFPLEVNQEGTFSFETGDLPDSTYEYTIHVTDKPGNEASLKQSFTVDTTTFVEGGLDAASDSGKSNTDSITNIDKPTISGRGESKSTIILKINDKEYSAKVSSDERWAIDITEPLPNGLVKYEVIATDVAGNTASFEKSLTLDTKAPTNVTITLDNDSGETSTDWITNSRQPKISGTVEIGVSVVLVVDGRTFDSESGVLVENGTWSFTYPDELSDGTFDVKVVATDKAGNDFVIEKEIVIDGTTHISGGLDSASDSGASNSDKVTNVNNPKFKGLSEENSQVKLNVGGKDYVVKSDDQGQWSIQVDELSEGYHVVTMTVTDIAGNTKTINETIVIDTTDPVESTISLKNDSGKSASDFITKNNVPSLQGQAEPESSVEIIVRFQNGAEYKYKEPDVVVDKQTGEWSFVSPIKYPDGSHEIFVLSTDAAGNTSEKSQTIIVDTQIELTSQLDPLSDSGDKGDRVTNNQTPTIKGTGTAGDTVTLTINGNSFSSIIREDGEWSITVSDTLPLSPDQAYEYKVVVIDAAGNTTSRTDRIFIDTETKVSGGLDSTSDSAAIDGITNDNTPKFSGEAEPSAVVVLEIHGKRFETVADEGGRWSIQLNTALSDSDYPYTITATDKAGNTHDISDVITVDTKTSVSGGLDPNSDSGNTDGLTNINKPFFSGKGEIGSTVTVTINGKDYQGLVDENNNWKIQITDALPDDGYTYQIVAVDVAGNKATLPEGNIQIDTKTQVSGGLAAGFDSGSSDSDRLTKFDSPKFSGSGEVGGTVTITIDGRQYSAQVDSTGQWEIEGIHNLSDGKHPYEISTVDAAGNKESIKTDLTVDTTPPEFTPAKLEKDTGSKDNDMITKEGQLVFVGRVAEVGTTIELSIDGKVFRTPNDISIEPDGSWRLELPEALAENLNGYNFKITYTDSAGNPAVQGGKVIVDTTNSITGGLSVSSDSGDKGDKTTNITKPTIFGHTEANAKITLLIDNNEYSTFADGDGNWRVQVGHNLSDKTHQYTVISKDVAGNRVEFNDEVTIDTAASSLSSIFLDNDSKIKGDWVSKNADPQWSGTLEKGTELTITIVGAGKTIVLRSPDDFSVDAEGNWTTSLGQSLDDSKYKVTFDAVDRAGNPSSITHDLEIDTSITLSGGLSATSDSGESSSDQITSNNTPLFRGEGESGAEVTLSINDTEYSATVDVDGRWSINIINEIPDGVYPVEISIKDTAGNEKSLSVTNVTIDTTDSVIESVKMTTDTGSSADDGITKESSPTFVGKTEPNTRVVFEIAGQRYEIPESSIDSEGNWSFSLPVELPDNSYSWRVVVTDKAGNTSEQSGNIKIDTVNTLTGGLAKSSDTGSSSTDKLTNDKNPKFEGTTEAKAVVTIRFSNGTEYKTIAGDDGTWSIDVTDGLTHGRHEYEITSVDTAGNDKSIKSFVDIDLQAPDVTINLVNDTGSSTTDGITKSRTPIFNGTSEAGASIELTIDNITYGEPAVKVNANGEWSFVLPIELDDSEYRIDVVAIDQAGNKTEETLNIEIDNSVFLNANLKASSDTGADSTDGITSDQTPEYEGSADAGSTITLAVNGKSYTAISDENERWQLAITDPLPEGNHTITITVEDKAGNTKSFQDEITIDRTAELSGGLNVSSDSGISNSDKITSDKSPLLTGLSEKGAVVTVTINGVSQSVEVKDDNSWAIQWDADLLDGRHKIEFSVLDIAENTSSFIEYVTVDTNKPDVPKVTLVNDTGLDLSDNITNQNRPELAGVVEDGERVTLIIDSVTYRSPDDITINESGEWSFRVPVNLDDKEHQYTVIVEDLAGNKNQVNGSVTVDTKFTMTYELDAESDSGIKGDFKTNIQTPTFKGQAEIGAKISIEINSKTYEVIANEDGSWELTIDTPLPHGDHNYVIKGIDKAGNEADFKGKISIDIETELRGGLDESSNSGDQSDLITNSEVIKFSGTGEACSKLTISIGGKTYEPSVDAYGRWEFTVPDTLDEGNFPYEIISIDAAGNEAKLADTIEIDRTNFVSAELKEGSDSGVSSSDNITNVQRPTFIGNTQPNSEVKLIINGSITYTIDVNEDGSFEFQIPSELLAGNYNYVFESVDAAGNKVEDTGLLVIDNFAELTGGLGSASNSGDKTDKLTNFNKPTFSGTAEVGSEITLKINEKEYQLTVGADKTWSITLPESDKLDDDTYQYTIFATDRAGNTSNIENEVTIDTVVELAANMTTDTGYSPTDGKTQEKNPSWNGTMEVGAAISITLNNKTYDSKSGITVNQDGTWSFTLPAEDALSDGDYLWVVNITDDAGNENKVSKIVTVDTTAPTDLTVELINGSVSDQSITSTKIPSFGGLSEAGTQIKVKIDGVNQPDGLVTVNPDGTWQFVAGGEMPDGNYLFEFISIDAAGNRQVIKHDLEIDTSTEVDGRLDSSTNTGTTIDQITKSEDIIFSGEGESGSKIEIEIESKTYETVVEENGKWSFMLPDRLDEGVFEYVITATDKAGNTDTDQGQIEVDRTNTIDVAFKYGSDSADKTDGITNVKQPTFVGTTQSGSTVTLIINGSTSHNVSVNPDGTFEFQIPESLDDGDFTYEFISVDVAGNRVTEEGSFVIDTVSELTWELSSDSDSGVSGDKKTNDQTPTFEGLAEVGSQVALEINGKQYTVTADADKSWSIEIPEADKLPAGKWDYTITSVDKAGNPKVIEDYVTIDINSSVTAELLNDTGSDGSDGITQSSIPQWRGTMEKGSTITLTINNKTYTATNGIVVNSDGTWTFTLPSADELADKKYEWVVRVVDEAGNEAEHRDVITVDTQAPTELTVSILNGTVEDTSISGEKTPTFGGNSEAGTTISVKVNGALQPDSLITTNPDGTWNFEVGAGLDDGDYVFEFISTDTAGNSQSVKHELEIDTVTTVTGGLSSTSDLGDKNNDGVTSSKELVFKGTGEPDAKIVLLIDGRTFETIVGADKSWTIDVGELDGSNNNRYDYTITATDKAGNEATETNFIIVDTVAPTNPTFTLDASSDTSTAGDWITKSENIVINGVGEPDSELIIKIGSNTYDLVVPANGQWTLDLANYPEGTHKITVTSKDLAGNVASHEETLVVDRSINLDGRLDKDSDTGISSTDNYTKTERPVFSGSSDPRAVITVTIKMSDGSTINLDAVADETGLWKTDPNQYGADLVNGTYEYTVHAIDDAVNETSFNDSFIVDRTISMTLKLDDSTNSSDTEDLLTNFEKPRFSGVGQPNDKITVWVENSSGEVVETISSTVASNGSWTADVQSSLTDGDYKITAQAVDKAGNSVAHEINITIDRTPPTILEGGLDDSTNTGSLNDNITKNNVLKFSGQVEAGCTVNIVIGGKTYKAIVNPDGYWSYQMTEETPDGNHPYTIVATDPAGNSTEISKSVTVDRTINFTGALEQSSDTGEDATDYITKETRPVFAGSTDPLSTVVVRLNIVPAKTISVQADADGNFSINLGDLFGEGAQIPEGDHSLTFIATDPAGNEDSFSKTLVVDTTKPLGLTVELSDGSDSNIKGDFITNDNTPVIGGKVEVDGISLKVQIDGKNYDVDINPDGTWQFAVPEREDGTHPIKVIAEDKAGNRNVIQKDLVIDTQIPDEITGLLSASSDKGQYINDGVTNINQNLSFDGQAEINASVVLVLSDKTYTAAVDATGHWYVTIPDLIPDGSYTAEVRVTDKAGNTGVKSIHFEVDTIKPEMSDIKLKPEDDTGSDQTDGITNVANPTIVGSASTDTAKVWITIDGTSKSYDAVINPDGSWSAKLSNIGEGEFTYTVHAVDVAGNTNESSGHAITVDTRNNVDGRLDEGSDSGASSSDGITNVQRPTFSGTTDRGNQVFLEVKNSSGDTVYSDFKQVDGTDFSFTVGSKLDDDDYTWSIMAVDKAGNAVPDEGSFTIDTSSYVTAGLSSASDTGEKGDNITNLKNPILSGDAEDSSVITVDVTGNFGGSVSTKTYTTKANAAGTWTLTIPDSVTDGRYTYQVTAVDKAGNTSRHFDGHFDVDRIPPSVEGSIVTDSGDPTDKITNGVQTGDKKGHLDFAGTTSGGATNIILTVAGRTYNITPNPDGTWEFVVPDKISDGKYTYTFVAEDTAGNKSDPYTEEVTVDTTIDGMATLAQESDSGEQGDNLTNKTKPIISGSGEAGLSIIATISGGGLTNFSLGRIQADTEGKWTLNIGNYISEGLSDGGYAVTLSATDKAGNSGDFTYRFNVDTTPPVVNLNKYNSSEVTTDKPKISGSGEVGATVVLVIDEETFSNKVASNGQWEFSGVEMPSFPDGAVEYHVYATDKAGNRSENVNDVVTINTGTFVEGALDETTDTGALSTDGITQNRTPAFKGNGEASGEITVEIRDASGTVIRTYTTTVAKNGVWEVVVPADQPLNDGVYSYQIKIVDSTGNEAFVEEKDLVIDNSVAIESIHGWSGAWGGLLHGDTWYLASQDNQIRGVLAGKEKGAEIKVVINGQAYVGVSDKNGNFNITLNLKDGVYDAKVYVSDLAGNTTESSIKLDVDSVSEWTLNNDDDVSGDPKNWVVATSRPTFSGTNDADNGNRIQVNFYGDTELTFKGVVSGGSWSIVPDQDVPDGTYSYRIIYWEKSGRWIEQRGTIIVDTVNEVMTVSDLDKVTDAEGNWTATKVTGFGEPHASITVTLNGVEYTTKVSTSAKWSIDLPITENGSFNFNVNSKDRAGNEVNLSDNPDNKLVVDLIDNLTVDVEEGGAFNPTDNPLTGKGDAGNSLRIVITDEHGNVIVRYAAVNSDGTWSINLSALADGQYSVKVIASSDWGEKEITTTISVDKTPPVIEDVELDIDTGSDPNDGVTSIKSPTFSGKVEAGSSEVTLTIGGVTYKSGEHFVLREDGTWSFTVPVELPDGEHIYKVTVSDAVGNESSMNDKVVIQSQAPVISDIAIEGGNDAGGSIVTNNERPELSGRIDSNLVKVFITIGSVTFESGKDFLIMADGTWKIELPEGLGEGEHSVQIRAESASGMVNDETIYFEIDVTPPQGTGALDATDNSFGAEGVITNSSPVFSGDCEVGATVHVNIGNRVYKSVAGNDGKWVLEVPDVLPDDKYLYFIEMFDAAGNKTQIDYDMFRIDSTPPAIESVQLDTDTGANGADGLTATRTPTFSGKVEAGASEVTFTIGDVTYKSGEHFDLNADGTWSFTVPVELEDREYTYEVVAKDQYGNATTKSYTVTIDATKPIFTDMAIQGGNDIDGTLVTSTVQPELSGRIDMESSKLTITIGSVTYESGTDFHVFPDGTWKILLPEGLPEGNQVVTVRAETESGAVTEETFEFEIDVTPPEGAGLLDASANEFAGGDTIINGRPIFSGTGEVGATVTITISSKPYSAVVGEDGNWSLEVSDTLADNQYVYEIEMTDRAGNTAQVGYGMVTVDSTAAPVAPETTTADPMDSDVSFVSGEGVVSGTGDFGEIIELSIQDASQTYYSAEVDFEGNWSVAITETLEVGSYTYSVSKTDLQGDSAVVQQGSMTVTAPEQPVEEGSAIEVTQSNDELLLSGFADHDTEVFITADGIESSVMSSETGAWSAPVSADATDVSIQMTEDGKLVKETVDTGTATAPESSEPNMATVSGGYETEEPMDDTMY